MDQSSKAYCRKLDSIGSRPIARSQWVVVVLVPIQCTASTSAAWIAIRALRYLPLAHGLCVTAKIAADARSAEVGTTYEPLKLPLVVGMVGDVTLD